jgi:hypothetical protein
MPVINTAMSHPAKKNTIASNMCFAAATYYALVVQYERLVFEDGPSVAVTKTLQACAKLYEYEGIGYLWRVAWPMFLAGLETDDLIHKSWVLERFVSLSEQGENMRRAKVLLEAAFLEQRSSGKRTDYLSMVRSGKFQGFVI